MYDGKILRPHSISPSSNAARKEWGSDMLRSLKKSHVFAGPARRIATKNAWSQLTP